MNRLANEAARSSMSGVTGRHGKGVEFTHGIVG